MKKSILHGVPVVLALGGISTLATALLHKSKKNEEHVIKLNKYAMSICDEFEKLLQEKGVYLPDTLREGDEEEPSIYGDSNDKLMDNINKILEDLTDEVKRYPKARTDSFFFF